MKSKGKTIIVNSIPFGVGMLLVYFFWRASLLVFVLDMGIMAFIILSGKDKRIEFNVMIYGLITGFVVEVVGAHFAGYQTFTKPDFLGIPFWLLVTWAYAFIFMKRVTLVLATGSPWTKNQPTD